MDVRRAHEKATTLLAEYRAQQHGPTARRALDLDDFIRFLNAAGILRVRVVFESWIASRTEGMIRRSDDGRMVEIVVAPGASPTRQRFTIAHELGHAVFQHPDGSSRNEASSKGTESVEVLANGFAAALLMPGEQLLADLETSSIEALADQYEVPLESMTYRVRRLREQEPAVAAPATRSATLSDFARLEPSPSEGRTNWDGLISPVLSKTPGREDAHGYHRAVVDLLSAIFTGELVDPKIELPIDNGTKRTDARFTNGDRPGFFRWFTMFARAPAATVAVECKNYTSELANEEVAQIASRLNEHRGVLGLLICRSIHNRPKLLERLRPLALNDSRYVLALDDALLVDLARAKRSGDDQAVRRLMTDLYLELVD